MIAQSDRTAGDCHRKRQSQGPYKLWECPALVSFRRIQHTQRHVTLKMVIIACVVVRHSVAAFLFSPLTHSQSGTVRLSDGSSSGLSERSVLWPKAEEEGKKREHTQRPALPRRSAYSGCWLTFVQNDAPFAALLKGNRGRKMSSFEKSKITNNEILFSKTDQTW